MNQFNVISSFFFVNSRLYFHVRIMRKNIGLRKRIIYVFHLYLFQLKPLFESACFVSNLFFFFIDFIRFKLKSLLKI